MVTARSAGGIEYSQRLKPILKLVKLGYEQLDTKEAWFDSDARIHVSNHTHVATQQAHMTAGAVVQIRQRLLIIQVVILTNSFS